MRVSTKRIVKTGGRCWRGSKRPIRLTWGFTVLLRLALSRELNGISPRGRKSFSGMKGHLEEAMARLPVDVRLVSLEVLLMTEDHPADVRLIDLLWVVDQMVRKG
jgi:hypothetical protein